MEVNAGEGVRRGERIRRWNGRCLKKAEEEMAQATAEAVCNNKVADGRLEGLSPPVQACCASTRGFQ